MHFMNHAVRWASVIALSAAAGCAPESPETTDSPAVGATTTDAVPSSDLADPDAVARRAAFTPCNEDPELECGQLSVPLDYAHPHGDQITLATVRAPALRAGKRGVIFVNPGGPGGSGVDFVILAKALFAPLRDSFDIVSFDPRGTARSQLADCTFEVPALPTSDTVEATAAFLDEAGARYARACREQNGALATRVGTNNVARDMDVFRAALGERELNYLGFSYGTALGASYATLFPHRVRAMVLDGNVTPAWFADYLLELDADGSAGAELALRRLDQLCRASADCPLQSRGVVAVYDRVIERLDANPVVVPGGVITGGSVTSAVFPALYQESRGWPHIVQVLAAADAADYTGLPPLPIGDGPTLTVPSTFSIVCDDAATRRPGLDYLPAQTGNHAIYPRFGGTNFGVAITLCSGWPRSHVTPIRQLETRNPVVLLGNDFDPATPMAWTRNMATTLGDKARLVRYQGGGHTVFGSGSTCIADAVVAYLRDLAPPPRGLTCPAVPISFAPSFGAGEATMAEVLSEIAPTIPAIPRRR